MVTLLQGKKKANQAREVFLETLRLHVSAQCDGDADVPVSSVGPGHLCEAPSLLLWSLTCVVTAFGDEKWICSSFCLVWCWCVSYSTS